MTRMQARAARANFSRALDQVSRDGERIVIHRNGRAVAALVPAGDAAFLEALEDRLDVEAARKALREKGSIPWEQIKKRLRL